MTTNGAEPTGATSAEYTIRPRALRLADMPDRLKPREQFEQLGADRVSDAALLALILRSGVRGMNVVDLADHMLRDYGSLTSLARTPVEELRRIKGMGNVKAQVLKAALELARRLAIEAIPEAHRIVTPEDAVMLLRERARVCEGEIFWVLLLDTKNRLQRTPVEISKGTLNASLAHPREVYREAIRGNCAAIVLVHNHPSGDPTPSPEDIRVTRQLVDAGKIVEIPVLDHIIIGRKRDQERSDFISLRETGLVRFYD